MTAAQDALAASLGLSTLEGEEVDKERQHPLVEEAVAEWMEAEARVHLAAEASAAGAVWVCVLPSSQVVVEEAELEVGLEEWG